MGTANDTTRFADLKARLAALGHKLVTCPGLHDVEDNEYTGLFIVNPKTDEIVISSAGSAKEDRAEIIGWCEEREEEAETGAHDEPSTLSSVASLSDEVNDALGPAAEILRMMAVDDDASPHVHEIAGHVAKLVDKGREAAEQLYRLAKGGEK